MSLITNKNAWLSVLAVALVLGCCAMLYRLLPSPSKVTVSPTNIPGETLTVSKQEEEIFRRAFWRHPTKHDKILQAERREWSEGNASVKRWQWFIKLRPGADLVKALRTPDTFGLMPTSTPRAWVNSTTVPDWFPPTAETTFEVLQTTADGLTVLYRASDNTLYATDHGRGFAPATRAP